MDKTFEEKAKFLVAQMTLEEKCTQTVYRSPAIPRLGIQAYNWWNEALHGVARAGVATVFPQAIGLAATFDEDLIETVAEAIATEGRGKFHAQQEEGDYDIYKGLTFWAPNVNIFRDPRWGRGHETFGEDPFLTSRLGVRFVQGLQGKDPNYLKSAACAKHFAVHSGPEHLRHSFDAVVSKKDLYETYLPAFEACVEEGKVEAVMGAYNRTNGEPCCGSQMLLVDILRGQWHFQGHVVSDCWAIKDFHEYHGVTSNALESVAMAINHGCDLNCGNMYLNLMLAYKEGLVTEETIDQSVQRLLITRMKLGILEAQDPGPFSTIDYGVVNCKAHQELNEEVTEKTIVLLKNENNILPLQTKQLKTIGVIGPNANSRKALEGNYQGTAARYVTVLEGIQDAVGASVDVLYAEGCHLFKERMSGLSLEGINDRISEALIVARRSDVVIMVMGLDSGLEGEEGDQGNEFDSGDKKDLRLPGIQHELIQAVHAIGKPMILITLSGSALSIPWEAVHMDAIVHGWYPGALGGKALANILFGHACPEGKLPVTFYHSTEELPDFLDYNMTNRTYRYMKQEALYPFGFGLSYTTFDLKDVTVTKATASQEDWVVTATIKNSGHYDGSQTVQVYVEYPKSYGINYQLKELKKVHLKRGASEQIQLLLPKKSFGLYNEKGFFCIHPGAYKIHVGFSQPDQRSALLMGGGPQEIPITLE